MVQRTGDATQGRCRTVLSRGTECSPVAGSRLRARAARTFLASLLLAVVMLALSALNAVSSRALTLPSVSTPSVSTPSVPAPSVHVPSVSTPVGRTPSVSISAPLPSPPSVHTPSVSVPAPLAASLPRPAGVGSLVPSSSGTSAAHGQAGSGPSAPAGAGTSTPGGSAVRPGSAGPTSGTRSHGGAGPAAITRRAAARRQRQLQALVRRFAGCLSDLPPQAEHLLLLLAGVGLPQPYSSAQAARLLGLTARGEAQAENGAVSLLQGAAHSGGCGNNNFVFTGVPAQDHLVSWFPALSASTSAGSSAPAGSSASGMGPSGAGAGRRAVSTAHAVRPPAHRPMLANAVRLSTSSPGMWFVLAGFALFASLAVLSAVGRKVAAREPLMAAAAPAAAAAAGWPAAAAAAAAPAASVDRASTPEEERPPTATPPVMPDRSSVQGVPSAEAQAATNGAAHQTPMTSDSFDIVPARYSRSSVAYGSKSAATSSARAPDAGPSDAPSSPEAVALPPVSGPAAPNQTWMQDHRTHIALGLTALAGGAARLLARRRR